jgi:protein-tyrosine phosphatase
MSTPIRIQFVCLGNICRSPLAKVVFRDKVNEAGLDDHFEIVSSGTGGWHIGDTAHLDEDDEYGGKVRLFREFDPEPDDYQVPDPYHGGRQGFERVYDIVERTSDMLLHRLVDEYDLEDEVRSAEA